MEELTAEQKFEVDRWQQILQHKIHAAMVAKYGEATPLEADHEYVQSITARAFIESAYELNSDRINKAIIMAWTHLACGECEEVERVEH